MKHILLFPGGFKPFHDGHLAILENYIKTYNNIDEVIIIISNKNRSGITFDTTLFLINNIKKHIEKQYNIIINIVVSEVPSPISYCYKIVGNSEKDNLYCLVSSSKDDDKRVQNFINDWSINGKYYKGYEKTFNIDVNIDPILYIRSDEFNKCPISSTILRNDIFNRDYENFRISYKNMLNNNYLDEDILKEYYNMLKNIIDIDKKDIAKLKSLKKIKVNKYKKYKHFKKCIHLTKYIYGLM